MLLFTSRSRLDRASHLLIRQVVLRHASKATRGSSKRATKAAPPSSINKADRGAHAANTTNIASSSTSKAGSNNIASDALTSERYVNEKIIYEMGPNEKVADARLLLGFGLMFCIFCINGADIVRREPKQPADPEAPRVEGWPAWKRWGAAGCFATIGLGIGAYCVYWPTRILKKITLIAPTTSNPTMQIPTIKLQKSGIPTTPYQQCKVKFTTSASELIPSIFKAPSADFSRLRLLGPLSNETRWYHPKNSAAFGEKALKRGKLPSNVPLAIEGTKIIYNIRKAGSKFHDLEGLERALLMNDVETRVEQPRSVETETRSA